MLTESYPSAVAENVTYTYDNITTPVGNKGKGHLTGITYPSGRIVTYTRNANGQVTGVGQG